MKNCHWIFIQLHMSNWLIFFFFFLMKLSFPNAQSYFTLHAYWFLIISLKVDKALKKKENKAIHQRLINDFRPQPMKITVSAFVGKIKIKQSSIKEPFKYYSLIGIKILTFYPLVYLLRVSSKKGKNHIFI